MGDDSLGRGEVPGVSGATGLGQQREGNVSDGGPAETSFFIHHFDSGHGPYSRNDVFVHLATYFKPWSHQKDFWKLFDPMNYSFLLICSKAIELYN